MITEKEKFEIDGLKFETKKEAVNPLISLMKDSKLRLIDIMFIGLVPVEKKMGDYFYEWLK